MKNKKILVTQRNCVNTSYSKLGFTKFLKVCLVFRKQKMTFRNFLVILLLNAQVSEFANSIYL